MRWAFPKEANNQGNHRTWLAERSRRSGSVDSREELPMAQVRHPTCTWSPKLEVDDAPIAWDASFRHYRGGHVGHVAKALEQPLLFPKDMEAYKNFNHPKLFLSIKRDLAMISYLIHCFIHRLLHFLVFYTKGKTYFFFRLHNRFLWPRNG